MKQEQQTTAIAKIEALDLAIERGIEAQQMAGRMSKAIAVAGAMADIKAAFTPAIMDSIIALQDSPLGFMTDRNPATINKKTNKPHIPYPPEVVRDCAIEALLQGVQLVGNEFNIIGGRCYIALTGTGRKLSNIKGLSYTITPGVPHLSAGGAVMPVEVEWQYGGVKHTKTLQLCIRVNEGMGADAISGKATRKARAWLFAAITGQEVPEGEVGDDAKSVRGVVIDDKQSRFEPPKDAEQLLGEGVK
jgi:hypothetical protein